MTAAVGLIDLRSDTVPRPSPEMRGAIAAAPVGDDQFGEDPTVNLLQERVATLPGKEAALWLPPPPTTLVEIENTHNRAGGVVFPQDEAERASAPRRATMASPRISTAPVSG